jgi:hypothetical protein
MAKGKVRTKDNLTATQKLILRDLEFGPSTKPDLLPIVGIRPRTMDEVIKELHASGLIYICGWERSNKHRPIWALGNKRDCPPLKRLSSTDRTNKWRAENPDKYNAIRDRWRAKNKEEINARRREEYWKDVELSRAKQRAKSAAWRQSRVQSKSQEKKSSPASFTSFIQMVQNAGT